MASKVVDSAQLNSDLTSIANAIRTKGSTSAALAFPDGFISAIENLSGGGSATLIEKSVNANGVYNASSDSADGYSKVVVSVPASAVDTGTKNITANGNNQDVVGYAAVNVNVPNTYAAGDEGKVVSNGALVTQTAHAEVTQNGTIDTTLNDSVTVNVSGGGSVKAVNILDGVVLYPGYLSQTGVPQPQQSPQREVYTDEIDVSEHIGDTLVLLVATNYANAGQQWLGYCAFDANHSIIGIRQNISPTGSSVGLGYAFTIPSCKYIRLSWRTYGNSRHAAGYASDLYNAMASDGWGSYIYA